MIACEACGTTWDVSSKSFEELSELLKAMERRLNELSGKRLPDPLPPDPNAKPLHCSLCGKSQNEVETLIASPTVNICDQCVDLCNEIIKEKRKTARRRPRPTNHLP